MERPGHGPSLSILLPTVLTLQRADGNNLWPRTAVVAHSVPETHCSPVELIYTQVTCGPTFLFFFHTSYDFRDSSIWEGLRG